jgi:hypothetical protein
MYRSRFLDFGASWECAQLHAPAALPPGFHWIGGWMNDMEKLTFLTLPGLELPPLGLPALAIPSYNAI